MFFCFVSIRRDNPETVTELIMSILTMAINSPVC